LRFLYWSESADEEFRLDEEELDNAFLPFLAALGEESDSKSLLLLLLEYFFLFLSLGERSLLERCLRSSGDDRFFLSRLLERFEVFPIY
jgi:hypothetical protein